MARRRNKAEERQTARRRVEQLLQRARAEVLGPDAPLADRYGQLALRVGRRFQAPLAAAHKAQLCRRCGTYRRSATARVRVHRGRLVTTCLACGDVRRRPLEEA